MSWRGRFTHMQAGIMQCLPCVASVASPTRRGCDMSVRRSDRRSFTTSSQATSTDQRTMTDTAALKPAPLPVESALSDLETLLDAPFALLLRFIGHDDLPSLIKLAATNKFFQQKIYRSSECRHLWKTIDFSKVGPDRTMHLKTWKYDRSTEVREILPLSRLYPLLTVRERLNDASLRALLRRVDAKHTTNTIILAGCKQVTGAGLDGLVGSKLLRVLDLRFSLDKYQSSMMGVPDVESIRKIIMSMPPFFPKERPTAGLQMLLGPFFADQNATNFRALFMEGRGVSYEFLSSFRSKVAHAMRNCMTPCSHCCKPVSQQIISSGKEQKPGCSICKSDGPEEDHHTPEGFELIAANLYCLQCKKVSCGQNDCPETLQCSDCDDQKCAKCHEMKSCKVCDRIYCSNLCGGVWSCYGCGLESSCETCDDVDGFLGCERCGDVKSCDSCNLVRYCDYCGGHFCQSCEQSFACSKCHNEFCQAQILKCHYGSCNQHLCFDCYEYCLDCGYAFCSDHFKAKVGGGEVCLSCYGKGQTEKRARII